MLNLKHLKSISIITILSFSAFAGTYQTKTYADDTSRSTSLNVDMKSIERKLADADKEAEPIYSKMDKIQKTIDNIRTTKLTADELSLINKINRLNEKHQKILEKFYNQLGEKRWHSEKRALELVSKAKLSKTEKTQLNSYFKTYYAHQLVLDEKYDHFNHLTKSQQHQLESLTKKADDIYKKHGITKDILMSYYTQKGMSAD